MSSIPESIRIHRPKGTEIIKRGDTYYVAKVKAYYDKTTKKPKRRHEGIIGKIYEGVGFVPYDNVQGSTVQTIVHEYGNVVFLLSVTKDLYQGIADTGDAAGLASYAAAILQVLYGNVVDLTLAMDKCCLGEVIPEVNLSLAVDDEVKRYRQTIRRKSASLARKLGWEPEALLFQLSTVYRIRIDGEWKTVGGSEDTMSLMEHAGIEQPELLLRKEI